MNERSIIFTGGSINSIQEGRKTMTRRVIRFLDGQNPGTRAERTDHTPWSSNNGFDWQDGFGAIFCPYGQPGDRLWVRETWGDLTADNPLCKDGRKPAPGDRLVYRANPADDYQWGSGKSSQGDFCWRPSIFMPRWASRFTLEIVSVRVERVQDISEQDAIKEGIEEKYGIIGIHCYGGMPVEESGYRYYFTGCDDEGYDTEISAYRALWDSINATRGYGWDVNPWVWAIEYKRIA